ncbi:response regulator [Mariprofundus erugo]|uniref:response regulator transcription factor n=1 Tax=Mariprofundus erugo TaxID=2528639 RepID=UPI0010FDF616|nr:response regulator transcription factor [Mariprofundus erugo]TLS74011.1 response regulator [Mariprofundus erugo]
MNTHFSEPNNMAIVISHHSPARQQAINWLEQQGYECILLSASETLRQARLPAASLFVIDISPANRQGIEILQHLHLQQPQALLIALCRGGNSPVMRRARTIGIDGFLYMDDAEATVDLQRGFAATVSMFQTDHVFRAGSHSRHQLMLSQPRHTHVTTVSSYPVRMHASSTRRFPWVPADH